MHWRSSARVGELMVRREEQPWQSRATVFLDNRGTAHRGQGVGPAGPGRQVLDQGDALYPMFATHNAQTIAAIRSGTCPGRSGVKRWMPEAVTSSSSTPWAWT